VNDDTRRDVDDRPAVPAQGNRGPGERPPRPPTDDEIEQETERATEGPITESSSDDSRS
jgi:hypothetical protein